MDAELLELARTVDLSTLGARIKSARVAKRLTQTDVAGPEMSTAYVSRIESGQRRPDPELLAVIAGRIGLGLDELVMGTTRDKVAEIRLALDWAELSSRTGDAAGALRQVDDVLGTVAEAGEPRVVRDALRIKAVALEATGARDEAIVLLEDLTEAGPQDLAWVDDMKTLSRCYRDSGDLARAVEAGERGMRQIGELGLEGTDEALGLALVVASAHAERGDTGHANRLVRRALAKAEELGSPEARAKAYWTASIMASRSGDSASALEMARSALALLEQSEDMHNIAKLRSQLGILALRVDQPDPREALLHLLAAQEELLRTDAPQYDRAVNRLHQARAHLMLGRLDDAEAGARESRAAAGQDSPLVAADASVLLGQVAMARSDQAGARAHYRDAVTHLLAVDSERGAAQLWFELGCLLEDVADTIGALDAYRRAGASTGLLPAPASTRAAALRDLTEHVVLGTRG